MDPKRLLLLLGILVVLVGVSFFSGAFERDERTISVPKLDIPGEEVTSLTLVLPDDSLVLVKSGSRWMLTSPVNDLSDSVTVANFLRDLSSVTIETAASYDSERWARYGVNGDGVVLTASWEGDSQTVIIGSQGPDYQSAYVRLPGDERVFVTHGRLAPARDLDRWRDKLILDIAAQDLASVSVHRPDGSYVVQRGPLGWTLDDAPADSASVAVWLRRFASMRADGFYDELPPVILQESSYELALQTTAGATEVIRLIEYEDELALTTSAGETTYRLQKSRLDSYFPDPESLQ